jgi:hypothetical protein
VGLKTLDGNKEGIMVGALVTVVRKRDGISDGLDEVGDWNGEGDGAGEGRI